MEFILSMSVVFPLIIGLIRWRIIDTAYYPFIYDLLITLLVELLVWRLDKNYNTINSLLNIFSLVDFSLLAWLFHKWGLFNYKNNVFISIIVAGLLAWTYITFFMMGFIHINNPFLILYSATLIVFSVTAFNKIVVQQRINIFTNSRFWICMGIIIFYSFFLFTRVTDNTGITKKVTSSFQDSLQLVNSYSNVLVNLLYAVALIWVPRKKNIPTLL